MEESERSQLAAKLQTDLDEYISQLKPKKYEDGWPEDKWEEEMAKHPFFMNKPVQEGEDLPPLVEAIQQLKYDPDENTPEELAKAYKEDGNQYFKVKKYRWAVEAYTEGLKNNCCNQELVSQLFANRAAAHFHIGNYKKSLDDAIEAKTAKPGNLKAICRGAQCCFHLKKFDDCIAWCDEGLENDSINSELKELKAKALKEKGIADRDKRRAAAQASKKEKEFQLLEKALRDRGIFVSSENSPLEQVDLQPVHESLSDFMVHFDDNGCLIWPVLLLYPEYQLSDCIQQFHEDSCFADHLKEMFSEENKPYWDEENKYQSENLQVYFGCGGELRLLVTVDQNRSLKYILSDKGFKLFAGTPTFFVTAKGSKFDNHWSKQKIDV